MTDLTPEQEAIVCSPQSYAAVPEAYAQAAHHIIPWVKHPAVLPDFNTKPYRLIQESMLRAGIAYQHMLEISKYHCNGSLFTLDYAVRIAADSVNLDKTHLSSSNFKSGLPQSVTNGNSLDALLELQRLFLTDAYHYSKAQAQTRQLDTKKADISKVYFQKQFRRVQNIFFAYPAIHITLYTKRENEGRASTVPMADETANPF